MKTSRSPWPIGIVFKRTRRYEVTGHSGQFRMDMAESEFCSCDSSSFIPSSESDPPPPVSYHVEECKPGDIRTQDCEVIVDNPPTVISIEVTDTTNSSNYSLDTFNPPQNHQSFTQADDFLDLSKENLDPSKPERSDHHEENVSDNTFKTFSPNRTRKSLGHNDDSSIKMPNRVTRLSEPLSAHKVTNDSSNSPFLSGLESLASSLTRLPNSASILNSSDGGGEEGDISVINDRENSFINDSDNLTKSKDAQRMTKQAFGLDKVEITESVDSIVAVNLSAVVYRMDNTNDVVFDRRFNVIINDVNLGAAYQWVHMNCTKLMNELSLLMKPKQIQTKPSNDDSILSTSPPTVDSYGTNVLSSHSLFRSTSLSVSNSDSIQHRRDDIQGIHDVTFKSPGRTSSSGSDLFIPRFNNKFIVEQLKGRKSPVRASTTSSSSSDLFIPRPANKHIRDLKDKSVCESSSISPNSAHKSLKSNLFRSSLLSSSLDSNNKSIHGFNHPPQLTLVSETPSEDTANEQVHYSNDEANHFVEETDAEIATTLTTKSTFIEAEDNTLTPSNSTTNEQWVYGKWKTEKNYYAGKISPNQCGSRYIVIFEDGTRARIKPSDLITVYLLPVGAEVSAELKDDNEYWGDCVIKSHSSDPECPYEVFCRTTNKVYSLRRGQVSIHESEVNNLRKRQLLPLIPCDIKISVENDGKISMSNSIMKMCASPEVSLSNLVFDKRKSRPKLYRSSWITPMKQLTAEENIIVDKQSKTVPSKIILSTHLRKRYRNQFKRKLSTTSVRINRVRNRSDSSNERSSLAKKQRLSDIFADDENLLTQPMSLETPVTKAENLNQEINTSQIIHTKDQSSFSLKSSSSIGLLQSLCQNLNIPIPSSTVFHRWTIILTGGAKNSNSNESSIDRNLLEQLIIACGGEIALEINPSLLNRRYGWESPELDDSFRHDKSRHTHFVALVSTDCCRTLKYFQALATLGSVPLLRIEWLLDSCREDAKSSGDESSTEETRNWPLYLLRAYPGRYELPRGFLSGSLEPISWWSVPVRYRSPAYQSIPAPSLFDLRGEWADSETNFRLLAIITNDLKVFGPGWLNILTLACGSNNETDESVKSSFSRIPLITLPEISQKLTDLFPSIRCRSKISEKKVNFVLVDKNHVSLGNNFTQEFLSSFIPLAPFTRYTCLDKSWVICIYSIALTIN
ncbi:tumor suppressor p53 binding 1 [Schistosoma japonicum]|nr:tumor suppressor p53 binding 1 [Schistosoma japonicum]